MSILDDRKKFTYKLMDRNKKFENATGLTVDEFCDTRFSASDPRFSKDAEEPYWEILE